MCHARIHISDIVNNAREFDLRKAEENRIEASWAWPGEIGTGQIFRVPLKSGLTLGMGDFQLFEDIELCFEPVPMPVVFHFLALSHGDYSLYREDRQTVLELAGPGFGSIAYFREWQGAFRLPCHVPFRGVVIYMEPELLAPLMADQYDHFPRVLADIANGNHEASFFQTFYLTSSVHLAVNEILNCPYTGALKSFYLEAKAMEFTAYALSWMLDKNGGTEKIAPLSSEDIQRVHGVRQFLLNHLETPPSLMELTRRSGTNKNKLNNDFRKVFGTSIFEFLRISRLERARFLLETKQMNVTQVAFEVGYAHQQSFSRAFQQYFGVNPADILR
ncbi:MAG: hypothetical protein CSA81_00420 [Acidobacteria bacterium]|nr:MAG: hypothetical protein CSA81_00420 [Acidobacteriota bacterium]